MKKVAIVGAGASGLTACRHFAASSKFITKVFEKERSIGGTWLYDQNCEVGSFLELAKGNAFKIGTKSSVYKNLRTNLPKEVMAYPDYPFPDSSPPSFITHEKVQDYLESYCQHFNLNQFVQFGKEVVNIEPWEENPSPGFIKWSVKFRDMDNGEENVECFDSVIVCNGHFTVPYTPAIKNLSNFKGVVMHGRFYKKPDVFAGKTVAILGGKESGQDIAIDIATVAKKVLLCHRKARFTTSLPCNVEEKMTITNVDEKSGDLVLQDGETFKADALVFCTGYLYDVPFLSHRCRISVDFDGHVLSPLYKHIFSQIYPSLAFVGIPFTVCPFPLFDCQAKYIVAVHAGEATLPSPEDMRKEVQDELQEKIALGIRPDQFHLLSTLQWKYMSGLGQAANFELPGYVKKLYSHVRLYRANNVLEYRLQSFKISEDGNDYELVEMLSN